MLCQFELENIERAPDELARAYMGWQENIRARNPKYLNFLKGKILPPVNGG
jgi:hypothetical protein